ncbi:UNVERIFIED_CONTAM: hypothetical protein K2H54_073622 [Gekko kuhli]
MARKIPDSMVAKEWMTNICSRHTWKPISRSPSQKRLSSLGMVEEERTRSMTAQHAEEEVHGLVQAGLRLDDEEDGAVPHNGDEVQEAEGDGEPHVGSLQLRDAGFEAPSKQNLGSTNLLHAKAEESDEGSFDS